MDKSGFSNHLSISDEYKMKNRNSKGFTLQNN